jgi:hypothetical protein
MNFNNNSFKIKVLCVRCRPFVYLSAVGTLADIAYGYQYNCRLAIDDFRAAELALKQSVGEDVKK